ncbi:MAG: type 4a pilus biogenesis protein PilO [Acidobacteriaceae bacterium]|nr:type 4a pilus biogenesis protein PilO [Acidobacteriaceae bacterium]
MISKLTEMPFRTQIALGIGIAVALSAVFAFVQLKPMNDANKAHTALLKTKQKENAELRPYRDKEKELELKIATLKQQLEILKKIVPDEKEPDQFMHVMQDTATESGIEIRRYASRATANKEFYTEAPFDLELDGPYYSVLDFFERVGKLERIINVSSLQMSTVRKPMDARVKKVYAYAPEESTVASCLATTFFSHEPEQKPAAPAKK